MSDSTDHRTPSSRLALVGVVSAVVLASCADGRRRESPLPEEPALRDELLGEPVETVTIDAGELSVVFRDNSESPGDLSGLQSLFNTRITPSCDAFDPDDRGASAGLNFEHIICGHADEANKFTPRHGRYTLHRESDGKSVVLRRRKEDSPWAVSSTTRYTVVAPHAVDFEFRCVPHDASRFGERGYAIFFWADYMNQVDDVALHFLGIDEPGGEQRWISVDAPKKHVDWSGGGTYRSALAPALEYDADHDFKLNVWSYEYPRFTKPFYVGRAANGMCLILMFDRMYRDVDEIRFSLFKFKVKGERRKPAWDFQYVVHRVRSNERYGYNGRLIWKRFVSYDDCVREYEAWSKTTSRAAGL